MTYKPCNCMAPVRHHVTDIQLSTHHYHRHQYVITSPTPSYQHTITIVISTSSLHRHPAINTPLPSSSVRHHVTNTQLSTHHYHRHQYVITSPTPSFNTPVTTEVSSGSLYLGCFHFFFPQNLSLYALNFDICAVIS